MFEEMQVCKLRPEKKKMIDKKRINVFTSKREEKKVDRHTGMSIIYT